MIYLIGDLHANVSALERLLEVITPAATDELVFLGDYLDKNVDTHAMLAVLARLDAAHRCTFIKGNHDVVWDRYLNHEETGRQEFLLRYGSREAITEYTETPEALIAHNDIPAIRKFLAGYLALLPKMVDYWIVGDFLAMHAGLLPEQLDQDPLQMAELNYFLRPEKMDVDHKYLGRYTVVGGHTYLSDEPVFRPGYINVDLGAGYGKYVGALCVERRIVIRSDGRIFPFPNAA